MERGRVEFGRLGGFVLGGFGVGHGDGLSAEAGYGHAPAVNAFWRIPFLPPNVAERVVHLVRGASTTYEA